MTTQITLNENEITVLKAVAAEIIHCTNGEFGYFSDVRVEGMSKQTLKGYFSQLVQKGMCCVSDDSFRTVNISKAGVEAIGANENDYDTFF